MQVSGSVAIVTGAASGTGRAIALRLATGGALVVVADIDEANGPETVELIESVGGRARFVLADVTSEPDVEAMIAAVEEIFGGLDLLVNNAGGTAKPHYPEAPTAHWSATLDLNLRGPMLAIQHALPAFRRRGGGAIVNISSVAGVGTAPHGSPEYAAAKAGLARLTATLAPLAESANVRVNCIVPNYIGTETVLAELAAMSPAERARAPAVPTTPEEIAELVVELAEDESLTGRIVVWWTGEEQRMLPVDPRHGA
jgi:NAD(P)-dependent dehydrogenase (short-subunit alcohol dehydrogenase family)